MSKDIHTTVEVAQVQSYEEDGYLHRNFEIRWDAPPDTGALYKAVGKWLAAQYKLFKHRFDVAYVHGDGHYVTVAYRVRGSDLPAAEATEAVEAP
jgi:hypothetical protein